MTKSLAEKLSKLTLLKLGFLQALGVSLYCSLIALFMNNAEKLFGSVDKPWAPVLFLTLFSTSVLICGLITFGYPFILFWEEKKVKDAVRLVMYTSLWLVLFVFLLVLSLVI